MLPVYLILLFYFIYEWLFLILNFIPECSMPYVDGIFLITCYVLLIIEIIKEMRLPLFLRQKRKAQECLTFSITLLEFMRTSSSIKIKILIEGLYALVKMFTSHNSPR